MDGDGDGDVDVGCIVLYCIGAGAVCWSSVKTQDSRQTQAYS